MARIGAAEARANFAELLRRASVGKQAIVIERRGKACAALVPIEDLELIENRRQQARRSTSCGKIDCFDKKSSVPVESFFADT